MYGSTFKSGLRHEAAELSANGSVPEMEDEFFDEGDVEHMSAGQFAERNF